jgi:hypothetical protein
LVVLLLDLPVASLKPACGVEEACASARRAHVMKKIVID